MSSQRALSVLIDQLSHWLSTLLHTAQTQPLSPTLMLRRIRKIAKLHRTLLTAEAVLHHMRLKAAMLADPVWRARVLRDLGGLAALTRWHARARLCAGQVVITRRHSMLPPGSATAKPKQSHRAKTDRAGQFRLMPVSRPRDPLYAPRFFAPRAPRLSQPRIAAPIALHPSELLPTTRPAFDRPQDDQIILSPSSSRARNFKPP